MPRTSSTVGPWCNTWVAVRASPGHAWSVGESNPCVRTIQLPAETPRMEQVGVEPTSAGCASRLARLRFRICPECRCPIRAGCSDPTTLAAPATAVKVPPALAMRARRPAKLAAGQPEEVAARQALRFPAAVGGDPQDFEPVRHTHTTKPNTNSPTSGSASSIRRTRKALLRKATAASIQPASNSSAPRRRSGSRPCSSSTPAKQPKGRQQPKAQEASSA